MFDKESPTSMMGRFFPEISTISYLRISFVKIQVQNYAVHTGTKATHRQKKQSQKRTRTEGQGVCSEFRIFFSISHCHGKFLNIILRFSVTPTDKLFTMPLPFMVAVSSNHNDICKVM